MKNPKKTCLGPVADLEKYIPSEWWRTLFNSLYLKTDADVVENNEATRKEVDIIVEAAKIEPANRILDLCCGQGRHTLELASRGFRNLHGIDRSRYLIRLARKRAAEKGYNFIQFHEGDARKTRLAAGTFDAVLLMGNSFGYFESLEEDKQVIREVNRILVSGGTILLDITSGDWMRQNFSPKSWEWIDQTMLVCRERTLTRDDTCLVTREVVIDAEKGVVADQFYAERLYTQEELETLLKNEGFADVQTHAIIKAESDRNIPDLGMMAHRMIITGKAAVKPPRASTATKAIECTVLLGDPRLPDKVKRGGTWNPEDFDVIHRLKEALNTLKNYHFSYFDNHKKLIQTLSSNPPPFVLNLCDEGFNNDAFLELHVPAFLEMLGVPYTGAGPTALGLCYNKALVRAIAKELEVPVPYETWIEPDSFITAIPSDFPAFVKPSCGDSSIGITKDALVTCAEDLVEHYDWLKKEMPHIPVLVQEFLPGNEYSVGLIGNGNDFLVLPILEVDYSKLPKDLPQILGYESKWLPNSPYYTDIQYKPAKLDEVTTRTLVDSASKLFDRLGCRDYARFDFRSDANGVIKLLEVNPNPGWCWDGKFNMMAGFQGLSYAQLLEKILQSARDRVA